MAEVGTMTLKTCDRCMSQVNKVYSMPIECDHVKLCWVCRNSWEQEQRLTGITRICENCGDYVKVRRMVGASYMCIPCAIKCESEKGSSQSHDKPSSIGIRQQCPMCGELYFRLYKTEVGEMCYWCRESLNSISTGETDATSPPEKKEGVTQVAESKSPEELIAEIESESVKVQVNDSEEGLLRKDGYIHRVTGGCGGKAVVPWPREEFLISLCGNRLGMKQSPVLIKPPCPEEYMVPKELMYEWGIRLAEFDTEALCVYGRKRIRQEGQPDQYQWLGVVPKQKCTAASVDVDDMENAIARLAQEGYRRVGTLHTHPGGMTQCSTTDTGKIWDDFGGVHIIIAKTGGVGMYYSVSGVTWRLDTVFNSWKVGDLWIGSKPSVPEGSENHPTLVGEVVGKTLEELITKPLYVQNNWRGGYSGYNNWSGNRVKGKGSTGKSRSSYWQYPTSKALAQRVKWGKADGEVLSDWVVKHKGKWVKAGQDPSWINGQGFSYFCVGYGWVPCGTPVRYPYEEVRIRQEGGSVGNTLWTTKDETEEETEAVNSRNKTQDFEELCAEVGDSMTHIAWVENLEEYVKFMYKVVKEEMSSATNRQNSTRRLRILTVNIVALLRGVEKFHSTVERYSYSTIKDSPEEGLVMGLEQILEGILTDMVGLGTTASRRRVIGYLDTDILPVVRQMEQTVKNVKNTDMKGDSNEKL